MPGTVESYGLMIMSPRLKQVFQSPSALKTYLECVAKIEIFESAFQLYNNIISLRSLLLLLLTTATKSKTTKATKEPVRAELFLTIL